MTLVKCEPFEVELSSVWEREGASPFPGQLALQDPEQARAVVRQSISGSLTRARDLFRKYPLLSLWATLTPLAEEYGVANTVVYEKISDALGLSLTDSHARNTFKIYYRAACQQKGIIASGNTPSDLFFPPLGVADSKLPEWSNAMVQALMRFGPPAIEDTPTALEWQKRALLWLPEGLARARSAIRFDQTAWYADLLTKWRLETQPQGAREAVLFGALETSMRSYGLTRDRIVGPPRLIWHKETLALIAEPSSLAQTIKRNVFDERITPGNPFILTTPWPDTVTWQARQSRPVECAPSGGELLVFDVETGDMQSRIDSTQTDTFATSSQRVIVVSRSAFKTKAFGPALACQDPNFCFVWASVGDALETSSGDVRIVAKSEPSITVQAPVLGRSGARILRAGASEATVTIQVHPDLIGPRILRVTAGSRILHRAIAPDDNGVAVIPFAQLGLDTPGDPQNVLFELLIADVSNNNDARAEIKVSNTVWPGAVMTENGYLEQVSVPEGYNSARSSGFILTDGRLTMDANTSHESAILCLDRDNGPIVYEIPFRSIRVWRHRVTTGEKERVALGAVLNFYPHDRQDSFTIEAPGCTDDLLIFGARRRWPFYARTSIEIPASEITRDTQPEDDRIALQDKAGHTSVLARICQVEAATTEFFEDQNTLEICFHSSRDIDAVGLRIRTIHGDVSEAGIALSSYQVDRSLPNDCRAERQADGETTLFVPANWDVAGRGDLLVRPRGSDFFIEETGEDGFPISIGLRGPFSLTAKAAHVASLMADPATQALQDHPQIVLQPHLDAIITEAAAKGMFTPLAEPWSVLRTEGGVPRGDLLSQAPSVFEHPLIAYGQLAGGALAPLASMTSVPTVERLPDLLSGDPLGEWMERLKIGADLPTALDSSALEKAFIALNTRLTSYGFKKQITSGALGGTLSLIASAYSQHIETLREYDRIAGQEDFAARLVCLLERFARAARRKTSKSFLEDTSRRTGLPDPLVGEIFTMLIKAAPEAFAYFLTLWTQAAIQQTPEENAV